jgi:hypothetical protein
MALCGLSGLVLECPQQLVTGVFSKTSLSWLAHLAFCSLGGYLHFFIMGIKRPPHEVDHSFPCGTNVTNVCSHAAVSPLYLKGITGTRYFYVAFLFLWARHVVEELDAGCVVKGLWSNRCWWCTCVCVCVCVCACACVRACARACACVCVCGAGSLDSVRCLSQHALYI